MPTMGSAILSFSSADFGNVSAAVAELWIKRPLTRLTPDLVFIPFASEAGPNAWKQIPVQEGKKVNFHRLPVLAANTTPLTEDLADPDPITAALIGVTASVLTYGRHMLIGDLAEDVAIGRSIPLAGEMMAAMAMRSFDSLIYAEMKTAGTTAAFNLGAAGASADISAEANWGLTMANLRGLALKLKTSNVRTYQEGAAVGRYRYVSHPGGIKTLRAITSTNEYVDLAKNLHMKDEALEGMHVGNAEGFAIFETTEVSQVLTHVATTSSAYQNMACGYEGVGAISLAGNAALLPRKGTGKLINRPDFQYKTNFELIMHGFGSAGTQDALNRRATVGYKFRTAAKVLDSNRVITHLVFSN